MTALTPNQKTALDQITNLAKAHDLKLSDIKKSLAVAKPETKLVKSEMILRLFVYLGGALIFAGLGVFIHMVWEDIGSAARVIITLGSGFTAYLVGVAFSSDARYKNVATPAFIMAFVLQPTGLFVFLDEYFKGDDAALGSMIVFGPLALQQGLTFIQRRQASLLTFTLLFGLGFAGGFTEYYDIDRGLSSLVTGIFIFFLSGDMQRREDFKDLTPFFYIVSTLLFFAGLYYFIGRTVFDPLALSFALSMLLFAVMRGSKTLYTLAMLFTAGYFCGGPGGGWDGWGYYYSEITAMFSGASLLLAGLWLRKTDYISLFPLWIFFGACYALGGAYSFLEDTPLEPAFAAIAVAGVYGALLISSRAALAATILAFICFISEFSMKHFADTVGWPIVLIFLGFAVLGAGFMFARLSGRIKQAAAA